MTERLDPEHLDNTSCLSVAAHRTLEVLHGTAGAGRLMSLAGLAAARWLRALAPHANRITVLCGPGNNGGDGLVMARWLHTQGLQVQALECGERGTSRDRAEALAQACDAGVPVARWARPGEASDVVVDAMLGIGQSGAPRGELADAVQWGSGLNVLRLGLDVPTGLDAAQGHCWEPGLALRCDHTLSFLAPKAGLFTGMGRQLAGEIWLDRLGCTAANDARGAQLWGAAKIPAWQSFSPRAIVAHAGHKGRQGDAWVLEGAPQMSGAACLAARAALCAGAGRVYLVGKRGDPSQPELMLRDAMPPGQTVLAGCGGGDGVEDKLQGLMAEAAQLVLDADALNAIARNAKLKAHLRQRKQPSVLTPHPLEAARLLGLTTADVQAARLDCAQALAEDFGATVVLKGSGTVVAHPGLPPIICTTGHAALASAGTGDVLAGWLLGLLAQAPEAPPQQLAALAATWHGAAAAALPLGGGPLLASALTTQMAKLHPSLPMPR